jgi:hypothetical protein
MPEPFPIVQVEPEWVLESEAMGTKDKFWFRWPQDSEDRNWLFKHPTPDTGQHWAEKIAAELADALGVNAPPVELAELGDQRGSATRTFTKVRTGETFVRYELYHGNQILDGRDFEYDPQRKFRNAEHTIQRIFESMAWFKHAKFVDRCRRTLAEYLAFDALIGNVDRHHENWGILRRPFQQGWKGRLAPSFDHASSLGRELRDEGGKQSRRRYLEELGVEVYARRALGAIFIDETRKRGPSPLELVTWCLGRSEFRPFFEPALDKVVKFDVSFLESVLARIPDGWMSPLEKDFVHAFVSHKVAGFLSAGSPRLMKSAVRRHASPEEAECGCGKAGTKSKIGHACGRDMGEGGKAPFGTVVSDADDRVRVQFDDSEDEVKFTRELGSFRLGTRVVARLVADQQVGTRQLANMKLISMVEYSPLYDEAAMDRFASNGANPWADVSDPGAWVHHLRGHAGRT